MKGTEALASGLDIITAAPGGILLQHKQILWMVDVSSHKLVIQEIQL